MPWFQSRMLACLKRGVIIRGVWVGLLGVPETLRASLHEFPGFRPLFSITRPHLLFCFFQICRR